MGTKARISFTFDDGNLSTYTNAFPILRASGLKGNLAVVTDWAGEEGRYSWEQIAEMTRAGWEVVAHTRTHDLWNMTAEKIEREIVECRKILNEKGYPGKVFISAGGPWYERPDHGLGKGTAFDRAVRRTYEGYMSAGHQAAITLPVDPKEFGRFGCECYDIEKYNAPLADILAAVDESVRRQAWCHLGWHDVAGRHVETFKRAAAHVKGYLDRGQIESATICEALGI